MVLGHRPDKRMIGQTIWTVRSNSWNIQRVCVAKGHELTRATSDQRVQVPKGCEFEMVPLDQGFSADPIGRSATK